jgi:hypothetical protein
VRIASQVATAHTSGVTPRIFGLTRMGSEGAGSEGDGVLTHT